MNIPFHKPVVPKSFDKIFSKSIMNGWLTTGPHVKEFENEISAYNDSKHTVAVNSCTAALHLALAAKNFSTGDKFIVPTYTFAATVEVGEYLGMHPILIDCDDDYNIDLNHVEQLLKKDSKIKTIIPVHFAGKPVDMKNLHLLCEQHDIFILEDAAHAFEAETNIGKVGNTNHAAAFSFYANKNITTAGEGGAISTNNEKLADEIRKLSLHGMSRDGWNRFKTGAKWKYDISKMGYKYNMTDISASYGSWQLKNINSWYDKRELIVNKYQNHLRNIDGIICPKIDNSDTKHAYHLYIIRLVPEKWKIGRDKMIQLLNSFGIGTSVHYVPIHMHSYYKKKYGFLDEDFKNAKKFSDNVITLPLYPLLSDENVNYIIDTIRELWSKHKL
jgi:dTDP-4-amino-4,6-dideoxygalactose transaminase